MIAYSKNAVLMSIDMFLMHDPGNDSIHVTLPTIKLSVCFNNQNIPYPSQGTELEINNAIANIIITYATGITIMLVNKKYTGNCPNVQILSTEVPICAAIDTKTMPKKYFKIGLSTEYSML